MLKAITTTYHGPTDYSGSRITARCEARRITVPYDHGLSADDNHIEAARGLRDLVGWPGAMVGGALPGGRGYAFVFVAPTPDIEE